LLGLIQQRHINEIYLLKEYKKLFAGQLSSEWKTQIGFKRQANTPDRNSHLYIDGIDGNIQYGSNLFVLKAILPDQFKDHFAAGRQIFHSLLDLPEHFCRDQDLFRINSRSAQGYMNMIEGFGDTFPGLSGEIIKGRIFSRGIKVYAYILNGSDTGPLLPDPDKHIFHNLFRWFPGLDNSKGELIQPLIKGGIDLPEGSLIPCSNPLQEYG
jgi:hypothetical protein